jgi:hypothetical protein
LPIKLDDPDGEQPEINEITIVATRAIACFIMPGLSVLWRLRRDKRITATFAGKYIVTLIDLNADWHSSTGCVGKTLCPNALHRR